MKFKHSIFSLGEEFSIVMTVMFSFKVKIEFSFVIKDVQSNHIKSMENRMETSMKSSHFQKEKGLIQKIIIGYFSKSTSVYHFLT